jgi:hypothetical protein
LNSENSEVIKSILYFVLTVLIKPISLLFLPLMSFIIYKKGFFFYKSISRSRCFLILLLITILLSSSFFKTGCIFYPLNNTCFSKENISWSEKNRIKEYSEMVSLWAKGYWVQDKSKYNKIIDKKLYNQNYNWIKFWIEKHFFYKVFEFLLIIFGSIILIYVYSKKEKVNIDNVSNDEIIIFLLSFSSIVFWLNTVPQFRFGFSSIIIFVFMIFNFIIKTNIFFNKKKFFHILILGLIVLNVKNINRIKSEFERNDFYKFKNFPFYNEKIVKNDYSNLNKRKIFHVEILE